LACEKCFTQCIDFEYNEDIIFLKENYRLYIFEGAGKNQGKVLIFVSDINQKMKLKVIIHEAAEGGYRAEVPAIEGCMTQGETFDELLQNIYEAVEGCLSVDINSEY